MPYNRFIPSTSKDSGEEKVDESPQKYFANKDECEGKSGAEPSGSNINNFYLDRVGDQHIETDKNDESSKKVRLLVITYRLAVICFLYVKN